MRDSQDSEQAVKHLAACALREVETMPLQNLLLKAANSRGVRPAEYVVAEVEFVLDAYAPCPPQEVSPRWMRSVLVGLALIEQNRHN